MPKKKPEYKSEDPFKEMRCIYGIQRKVKGFKKRNWNVNHQNVDGDTFGHILACDNSASSIKVVDALLSKKRFLPNIFHYF